MINKFDMLYRRNMMYPQSKTIIIKLIDDNECLVTPRISFLMLDNFTQLYRFRRMFKIVELK